MNAGGGGGGGGRLCVQVAAAARFDATGCSATGLIVDIRGTGAEAAAARTIMLRADMDALRMTEENAGPDGADAAAAAAAA